MKKREIKFREWDKINKKMISEPHFESINHEFIYINKFFERTENSHFDVMQYTGLKDKNGKEIYEDDIIDTYPGERDYPQPGGYGSAAQVIYYIGEIDWSEGDHKIDYCGFISTWDYMPITSECEVIGNIYENPELLKKYDITKKINS